MLEWNDVVDVMRERHIILMEQTVFATSARPIDHVLAQRIGDVCAAHDGLAGGGVRGSRAGFEQQQDVVDLRIRFKFGGLVIGQSFFTALVEQFF